MTAHAADGRKRRDWDAFLGPWDLDPTGSDYALGEPPHSGVYRLAAAGEAIAFAVEWVAADGNEHRIDFTLLPDGQSHPYENPAVAETVTTTAIGGNRLDTAAVKDGQTINHAVRELSDDGETMTVTQTITDVSGHQWRNVSRYRRRSS